MFDQLEKYERNGHFFFMKGESLKEASKDIPDEPGVYCIYALVAGRVELVYIGKSGSVNQKGKFVKEQKLKGWLNNEQNGMKRQDYFDKQIEEEDIDALDIYWYVTFDKKHADLPAYIEAMLLQSYYSVHGRLPAWNSSF